MKKKIVIKAEMNCDKCRSNAMKIAAASKGVNSVEIAGSDETQLVIVGEGVDPVQVTKSLRKKLRNVSIISVDEGTKVEADSKSPAVEWTVPSYPAGYYYPLPYAVEYDHYRRNFNPRSCSVM